MRDAHTTISDYVKRTLIKIITLLSLLMAIALASGWLRGGQMADLWGYTWLEADGVKLRDVSVGSLDSKLCIRWGSAVHNETSLNATGFHARSDLANGVRWLIAPNTAFYAYTRIDHSELCGVGYYLLSLRTGWTYQTIALPYWALLPPFLILPAYWRLQLWKRRRRHARIQHGLCTGCGYDLRASKDRCPECGTPILARTKACSDGFIAGRQGKAT